MSTTNAFAALALDDDASDPEQHQDRPGEGRSGGAAAANAPSQPAADPGAADAAGWLPASAPRPRTPSTAGGPVSEAPTTPQKLKDALIFLDLEMTGLDERAHTILEIALLATDGALKTTRTGPALAIHQPPAVLTAMNAWSEATHARTGLTARCAASGTSLGEAEAEAVAFVCGVMGWTDGPPTFVEGIANASVREAGGEEEEAGAGEAAPATHPPPPRSPRLATLAGNSVHVDRAFLAVHMPALAACFSHRVVDVSGIAELAARWFPAAFYSRPRLAKDGDEGGGAHTAAADVRASLAELKHYRATVFKEDNKEAGKAVAQRYQYGTAPRGGRGRR